MQALSWGEFIAKQDWEGGIANMLGWGGPECFPLEIQDSAREIEYHLNLIKRAMDEHEDEYQEYMNEWDF